MRVVRCGVWVLLAGALAGQPARPAEGKKPPPDDFFGVWIEERRESGGKVYDQPGDLLGWDLAADDGGCWLRRGESVYSGLGKVQVRVDKNPVWLDLIGEEVKVKVDGAWQEMVYIRPGVVKRDGKKLVWVRAKGWYLADPKDLAEWSTRPKSFEVKKDDPWEKVTLYPGGGRYTTD
jgi:hypothetical protein